MDSQNKIPDNWKLIELKEIANLLRGVSYKKEYASKSAKKNYLPIIRANNINENINLNDLIYVPKEFVKKGQLIKEGDIIIAMSSGSKDLVGKAAQSNTNISSGFGAFCGLIRFVKDVNKKFFGYYFRSKDYRDHISNLSMGVNINNLRRQHIEELVIPLPPLPVQHRIVEKIEELFSELDKGIESLKKVKEQIRLYKQSVLKAAFSGKLVGRRRSEVGDQRSDVGGRKSEIESLNADYMKAAEPGVEYKSLNHDFQDSGITMIDTPKMNKQKSRESFNQENQGSDILPEGWKWVKLKNAVENFKRGPFGSTVKKEYFVENGFKVYEQKNAIYKDCKIGNYFINANKYNELIAFGTGPGDYIVSCSGTIGKIYRLPKDAPKGIINQALLRLRLNDESIIPKYFEYIFNSAQFQKSILKETRGSAMLNIAGVKEMKEIDIILPPSTNNISSLPKSKNASPKPITLKNPSTRV